MSAMPDASRAEFEAWKKSLPDDGCEGPTPFEIWQASRKAALGEAESAARDMYILGGTSDEAADAIKKLGEEN